MRFLLLCPAALLLLAFVGERARAHPQSGPPKGDSSIGKPGGKGDSPQVPPLGGKGDSPQVPPPKGDFPQVQPPKGDPKSDSPKGLQPKGRSWLLPVTGPPVWVDNNYWEASPPRGVYPRAQPPKGDSPLVLPPKGDFPQVQPPKGYPKSDSPRVQPPKGDSPLVLPPKGDFPQVQPPKGDPKSDSPKGLQPKGRSWLPPVKPPPVRVDNNYWQASPPRSVYPRVQPPKGDSPLVLPPKGDFPQVQPPKGDPKSDSPRVQPPKGDSPLVLPPKGDFPQVQPPKGDPKSDSPRVQPPKGDSPEERGPKSDSPPAKPPKSDSVHDALEDPPTKGDSLPGDSNYLSGKLNYLPLPSPPTSRKDFVMVISNPTPAPRDSAATSGGKVSELRRRLAAEKAKTKDFEKQSAILFTAISTAQNEVAKLKRERVASTAQIKAVNRKLLETQVKLINARQRLEQCQKSSPQLPASEVDSLADQEAKRLVEDRRKPSTELSHKKKYIRLLTDLRRRIRKEIDQINDQIEGTTRRPTRKPKEDLFPPSGY